MGLTVVFCNAANASKMITDMLILHGCASYGTLYGDLYLYKFLK